MTDVLPKQGQVAEASSAQPDDDRFHSVTTMIGCLDKPALVPWTAIETAKGVVRNMDVVQARLANEGEESAIDYIKGLRFQTGGNLSASNLGTLAHSLFDTYALTGTRPKVIPELHPDFASKRRLLSDEDIHAVGMMLNQFDRFLTEYQPVYQATEVVVYSPTYGYAGQCDAFLTIDGVPLICDYKTSRDTYTGRGDIKGPYPEVALQLAAYRHAEFAAVWRARRYESYSRRYYLLSKDEAAAGVPIPKVDGGAAIFVTPDYYAVHPVRCDEQIYDSFLYVCEAARWVFDTSKNVVGDVMTPPHPIAATDDDPFKGLPE